MQSNDKCFFCGNSNVDDEYIMLGVGRLEESMKYHLLVKLCPKCMTEVNAPVKSGCISKKTILKAYAQKELEKNMSHEEYIKIFGKNYL